MSAEPHTSIKHEASILQKLNCCCLLCVQCSGSYLGNRSGRYASLAQRKRDTKRHTGSTHTISLPVYGEYPASVAPLPSWNSEQSMRVKTRVKQKSQSRGTAVPCTEPRRVFPCVFLVHWRLCFRPRASSMASEGKRIAPLMGSWWVQKFPVVWVYFVVPHVCVVICRHQHSA